ncbi:MAG: response regulator [bacterium]|nr:response regulator [bacterium]
MNILLVERDSVFRSNMARVLAEYHAVEIAENAEMGFQIVLERDIHIIITGHQFGMGMGGAEFSLEIKRYINRKIFIILTSELVEPLPHGADRFISQPFDAEILLEIITDLMKNQKVAC